MHSLKRHASPSNASCRPPPYPSTTIPPSTTTTTTSPVFFVFPSLDIYLFPWFLCFLLLSLFLLLVSLFLFLYLLLEGDTPYTHTPLTLSEQLMLETRKREREKKKIVRRKTNKGNGKMHSSKPKEIARMRNLIICLLLSSAHPHFSSSQSLPV